MSLGRYLSGLGARFDSQALRPPAPGPSAVDDARARQQPAWVGLQAWCQQGAGPGRSSGLRPGAQPAVALRLAVAAVQGPDPAAALAWADAFARQLDGSVALAALSGGAQGRAALALRLRVKAQDAMWWRSRRPDDPWDVGWAISTSTSPSPSPWSSDFLPRRATLVLADRREADSLQPHLTALTERSEGFWHPVRWLWVGSGAGTAAAPGLTWARFSLV